MKLAFGPKVQNIAELPKLAARGAAPAALRMTTSYSHAERAIDGLLHGIGVAAAIAAVAVLLRAVLAQGDATALAAASIYGAGLLATLGLSAAYHVPTQPWWCEAVRPYDHAAIFVMIAGSYTPFAVIVGGATGYVLLTVVWMMAVAGVALKIGYPRRFERAAIALYLLLGWIGVPLLGRVIGVVDPTALWLLGVGGVLYTGGVAFHLWRTLPYHNAIWHACVLAAAACHYIAIRAALGTI